MDLRLLLEHVEPRAGDPAFLKGPDQGGLLDDRPAGGIHENRRPLHETQGPRVHQVARLRQERRVEADEVRFSQERLEIDARGAQVALDGRVGLHRVLVEHAYVEAEGTPRHRPTDPAEADDTEGFPVYVRAPEEVPSPAVPLARADEAVG